MICSICNLDSTKVEFYKSNKIGKKCKSCWRSKQNLYYRDNKEARKLYGRQYQQLKPEVNKASKLKQTFNMSIDEYNNLLETQNGLCSICGFKEIIADKRSGKIRNLAVDHCHKTGKVRGLLCTSCNTLLGQSRDNVIILKNAIKYLEEKK